MPGPGPNKNAIDVLLVEDDPSSAKAMIQLLNHCGCRVRYAGTVLDALPLLREPPQVALLDLMLPDGSGNRILEIIRSRNLKTKVAIITACRDREKLAVTAKLRPELILAKPIDFLRLLTFINGVRDGTGGSANQSAATETVIPPAAAA